MSVFRNVNSIVMDNEELNRFIHGHIRERLGDLGVLLWRQLIIGLDELPSSLFYATIFAFFLAYRKLKIKNKDLY
jgi:hypothetical protein